MDFVKPGSIFLWYGSKNFTGLIQVLVTQPFFKLLQLTFAVIQWQNKINLPLYWYWE